MEVLQISSVRREFHRRRGEIGAAQKIAAEHKAADQLILADMVRGTDDLHVLIGLMPKVRHRRGVLPLITIVIRKRETRRDGQSSVDPVIT